MAETNLFAAILAGGAGTRFWPASRRARPKQLLSIGGAEPMLVQTARRLEGLVPPERLLVVTGGEHEEAVRDLLPQLPRENVLVEPQGRNTAACAALTALWLRERTSDGVLALLPADHVVRPPERFRATLAAAAHAAAEGGCLMTLGVRPTWPATGYGYIELGEELAEVQGHGVRAVRRFVEKPDEVRARAFLESGRFLWNAGIFVWRADTILAAFERHAPEILTPLEAAWRESAWERAYPELPSLPVDVAILERASNVRTIPIDYEWSDVGSWTSVPEVHASDAAGNCAIGGARLVGEDASGCIVYGDPGQLVALVGVRDLVVVHAAGATLVCPRDRAQEVRSIVARLEGEAPEFL